MKIKWDGVLTVTLVICALITTGLVVYRQFVGVPAGPARPAQKPELIADWRTQLLGKGVQLGPVGAPVQLLEFADFECPFCASFHKTLADLRDRYPDQVAVSYVHFPLPMHRFAEPAARAAECASEQGRFETMHASLFAQQRQIGLKSWNEFAAEAGVPDLAAFEACVQSEDPVARIEAGRQLAEQLGVRATPTLIVNGWKLARPPSSEELDRMVKSILAGKSPI